MGQRREKRWHPLRERIGVSNAHHWVMFTTIKVGFFKTIRMIAGALLTRSVSMDLDFYRLEGGIYPDLAGGPQQGRQAGYPHALFIYHRAASSDDADRPVSKRGLIQ